MEPTIEDMTHKVAAHHEAPFSETRERPRQPVQKTRMATPSPWKIAAAALASSIWPADPGNARFSAEAAARQLRKTMLAQNAVDDEQCQACSPKEMQRRRTYPKVPALSTLIIFLEARRAEIYRACGRRANSP